MRLEKWWLCFTQIEADLGYPGGKARIIHKESDIITAFAINKVQSCRREALAFSDLMFWFKIIKWVYV